MTRRLLQVCYLYDCTVQTFRYDALHWLHIYDGRVQEVVWGMGGRMGEGTSVVLRIEKRAEHPPTRQPRPLGGSWSMIQHIQDFTLFWSEYGKCLHLEMMTLDPVSKRRLFTLLKWNKVWLPAGSKMIQHLWYNVMMCTIIHISEQWLRQPESGSIMVAIFFTAPLFSFKVKVFPRFLCKCVLYDSMFNILLFSFHRCHLFK